MKKFRIVAKAALALALVGAFSLNVAADEISDLQEERRETGSKKEEAQSLLGTLETGRNDILTTISVMDQQVQDYTDEITELEEKKEKAAAKEGEQAIRVLPFAFGKKDDKRRYMAFPFRFVYRPESEVFKSKEDALK